MVATMRKGTKLHRAAIFWLVCSMLSVGASCGRKPSHTSLHIDIRATAPAAVPAWLVQLPQPVQGIVAVGYSPLAPPERSLHLALENGYENLASASSTHVRADHYEIMEVAGVTRFIFPFESATEARVAVDEIRERAVALDTFAVPLSPDARTVRTYVLLGLDNANVPLSPDAQGFTTFEQGRPKWFHDSPESRDFAHGVGTCGHLRDVALSWDKVERLARLDLAGKVGVVVEGSLLDRQRERGSKSLSLREQHVEAILRSCLVVSRHYDPQLRRFYALVRMPVEPN